MPPWRAVGGSLPVRAWDPTVVVRPLTILIAGPISPWGHSGAISRSKLRPAPISHAMKRCCGCSPALAPCQANANQRERCFYHTYPMQSTVDGSWISQSAQRESAAFTLANTNSIAALTIGSVILRGPPHQIIPRFPPLEQLASPGQYPNYQYRHRNYNHH